MRLLLVEDDDTIAEPLVDGLGRYGFAVEWVRTGAAALQPRQVELILLDLGLPDIDGVDVCRQLRQVSDVPIIMLTARGSEADRVVGLELGADDYLAKPFSIRELVARIRAVSRRLRTVEAPTEPTGIPIPAAAADRARPGRGDVQVIGDLVIDRRARRVEVGGQPITLTLKEFDLLALLADDPGAVRSREQILETVWDPHYFGSTRTLDVHVASLRRKLGNPAWIETLRGVGFRLGVPADLSMEMAGGDVLELPMIPRRPEAL